MNLNRNEKPVWISMGCYGLTVASSLGFSPHPFCTCMRKSSWQEKAAGRWAAVIQNWTSVLFFVVPLWSGCSWTLSQGKREVLLWCWMLYLPSSSHAIHYVKIWVFVLMQESQTCIIMNSEMVFFPHGNQSHWLMTSWFEGCKGEVENGMSCLQEINFLFHCP